MWQSVYLEIRCPTYLIQVAMRTHVHSRTAPLSLKLKPQPFSYRLLPMPNDNDLIETPISSEVIASASMLKAQLEVRPGPWLKVDKEAP